MNDAHLGIQPHRSMWLLWPLLFVGLPALVAAWEARVPPGKARLEAVAAARFRRPATPPPAVAPVEVYALERDQARALNAAIPFSRLPNPAARPFIFSGSPVDLARATDCLAAAQLYEAGDDAVGERAVAQVVLNRVRHPAFPKTVCGVVFQGQERATGCQFTFTCDGALARAPTQAAWERARDIARSALAGKVYRPVGYATHYHTDWVVPYWSGSLDKIASVGTHLFFRW
ncbi:SleB-like protein, partial [Sphingomonas sp. BHC-A]